MLRPGDKDDVEGLLSQAQDMEYRLPSTGSVANYGFMTCNYPINKFVQQLSLNANTSSAISGLRAFEIINKNKKNKVLIRSSIEGATSTSHEVRINPELKKSTPKIFAAISELDHNCAEDLRMELKREHIRGDGLKWQLNTWAASTLYHASASYFIAGDDDARCTNPPQSMATLHRPRTVKLSRIAQTI